MYNENEKSKTLLKNVTNKNVQKKLLNYNSEFKKNFEEAYCILEHRIGTSLKLTYKDNYMIVPLSQLHKPIKTTMIPDKFIRDKMNKLYYYQWKPIDKNQTTLFDGEKND